MKKITMGILAHVDAGKTTLSESLLFLAGALKKRGRVDHQDAFLDTHALEKARGITIFSKPAVFSAGDMEATLLDTPGHVDFSAEMERTLQVLDYAVLVISAADGVQSHTRTLWRLLTRYRIPTFLFVNKMDRPGTDRGFLLKQLKEELSDGCLDFSVELDEVFYENAAMCGEELLERYLAEERLSEEVLAEAIAKREIFPCYFGSAMTMDGVEALLSGLSLYSRVPWEISADERQQGEWQGRTPRAGEKQTQELTSGEKRTQELAPGEKQTQELTPGEKQAQELTSGEGQTQELILGEKQTQELTPGEGQTQELTAGERRTQELALGEGRAKRTSAGGSGGFGARVYKIERDEQGVRLTHVKITNGTLHVREVIPDTQEKVSQIRIYNGAAYTAVQKAAAGTICALCGLDKSFPGQGLGAEEAGLQPSLEPVLTYQLLLPEGADPVEMLASLRLLEEEIPELHILWVGEKKEIRVQIMGEVQIEILKSLIAERFGVKADFGPGQILYKETITEAVEGVGHFEPLRHYAEVHLLLEPGERGSGLVFCSACSQDELDLNWQRLILTHLAEKEHRGVLTGAPVTDMRITLVAGRAHPKHTEGGDFRQATYRAVRQGLMQTDSLLLEPCYRFTLEVPRDALGRAMTDLDQRKADFQIEENTISLYDTTSGGYAKGRPDSGNAASDTDFVLLTGMVPVSLMQDYPQEVRRYTRGTGRLALEPAGYMPCHNAVEVIAATAYDADRDTENPSGSVFCSHGAGVTVPWDEVYSHMHLESVLEAYQKGRQSGGVTDPEPLQSSAEDAGSGAEEEPWIGEDEVNRILSRASMANKRDKAPPVKRVGLPSSTAAYSVRKALPPRDRYLLVDGYNIIFAWEELNQLAASSIDGARGKLQDVLCNYQGIVGIQIIVVFDAYRVQGHITEILDYHNIHVVYTKEAETADQYIEKFAHENARKYDILVATSDALEQIIIRGQGCRLLSARELEAEVRRTEQDFREEHLQGRDRGINRLEEHLPAHLPSEDSGTI